ncbi:AAA domain-containing protein [Leptospira sp. GIMC2001]|uniref:AAA domain-containing protein n=1 Tax=Leptospira sp. GIMC2001 TaxID=1513297 RepID=UPI00234B63B4|nr:AAA domain-containing protein [Leptospira sp. GIMC2001]WCL48451.1 AAA domain-containing protein [Leptospira sp. GIMC2001]
MPNYNSAEEEIQDLIEIYRAECEAERQDYLTKMQSQSIADRIKLGVSLYPLEIEEVFFFVGDSWKMILKSKNPIQKYNSFSAGTPISVFKESENQLGVISSIQDNKVTIIIDSDIPEWMEEGNVGIDIFYSEKTYKEGEKALSRLLEDKPDRIKKRREILGYIDTKPSFSKWKNAYSIPENFNPSQIKAIQSICTTDDYLVVQGPPGTGKTSVLVAAINELVLAGQKVLISAPTNAALDLILEKAIALGMNPLRLGQTSRVSDKLLPYSMDASIENHPITKQISKYKKQADNLHRKATRFHRNFSKAHADERREAWREFNGIRETIRNTERQIENELIRTRNPILATTVAASHRSLHKATFDICILDEATQSLEPLAWIPILRANRVVLAGDENQLPPTVFTNDSKLLNTLFIKTIQNFKGTDRLVFLDTQYRMEEEILSFSNHEFYEGKVATHESVHVRNKIFTGLFASSLVYIDTAGTGFEEEKSEESESTRNPGEAEFTINIAKKISEELEIDTQKIGIIAPYKEQIFCLNEKAQAANFQCDISTVDSFQGRERDVIILSLTRSNDESEIGFLKDYRRMNVSLTRARRLLVVIGDSSTLSTDSFYNRFIDHAKVHGDYHSAYEFIEL